MDPEEYGQARVLVWIFGGGLIGGWSSQAMFDGAPFAREGLVFVSINYRVGPLGFFAHPALSAESEQGASGNYGLLDQVAALRWVRRNIAAFGGDPNRVTIFGESAGGTSVLNLCASPLAKGLFNGAIAQSTWITHANFVPLLDAEAQGVAYAEDLIEDPESEPAGADTLAALRALPADSLWQRLGYRFQPTVVVDGWSLEEFPEDVFAAGKQHDVPLIAGTTADEGTVFLTSFPYRSVEAFRDGMAALYGDGTDRVLELYPVAKSADIPGQVGTLVTDEWFLRGTRKMLRGMDQVSSPAWQYVFTRESRQMPALGAHHAVELPYPFRKLTPTADEGDRELSRAMFGYWVQFAKTGDPNGEGLAEWPAWEAGQEAYLELGVPIRTGSGWRKEVCDVLEGLRARRMMAARGR